MPRRDFWYASELFGTRQLKWFHDWQSQFVRPERHYILPNAFEYEDFMDWQYRERKGDSATPSVDSNDADEDQSKPVYEGFPLAQKCKHPLHPAHPAVRAQVIKVEDAEGKDEDKAAELPLRCPKCILVAHLNILAALKYRWEELGAPWHAKNESVGNVYTASTKVYHHLKVPLVNTMDLFEDWAKLEAAWETAHPDEDIEVTKEFSATRTFDAYVNHWECPCPRIDEETWKKLKDAQKELKETKDPSTLPPSTRKSLSFTPHTPDGSHRSDYFYHRSSKTKLYSPGLHACPTPEGWVDTSFLNSHRYAISQSRILLVERFTKPPEITYRNLNCDPSFGDNKHVERLVRLVDDWLEDQHADGLDHVQHHFAREVSYIWVVEKKEHAQREDTPRYEDGEVDEDEDDPEAFNHFSYYQSLCGTEYMEWALHVGDVTEEDYEDWREARAAAEAAARDRAMAQGEEDDDTETYSDRSDMSSEEGASVESDEHSEVDEEEGGACLDQEDSDESASEEWTGALSGI